MRIELSDAELDYIARCLLARPMGEVEPIILNIRAQLSRQPSKSEAPAGMPEGASARPNSAGGDEDLLSLP